MKQVIILFLTIITLAACSKPDEDDKYVGYVEAEYIYIASPQTGWIETMVAQKGVMVNVGDVLFTLDTEQQETRLIAHDAAIAQADARLRDLSAGARPEEINALETQLDEAQARLNKALADRKRFIPLLKGGIESQARGDLIDVEYRAAAARVANAKEAIVIARLGGRTPARDAARASLARERAAKQEAQWVLEQRSITTKISGRIENIFFRQGEFATMGTPVLALLPVDQMKLRFFVPQADLLRFSLGQNVDVFADGATMPEQATISFIALNAEFTPPVIYSIGSREKLVFMIEATLPTGTTYRPGLPVDVRVP